MATPEQRESILQEVGSVFGNFQDELKTLHDQYWKSIGKQANSLRLPAMDEVLGSKFTEFAGIYSGFHGYLTMTKRVLQEHSDELVFPEAIVNVRAMCNDWSERLNQWKQRHKG